MTTLLELSGGATLAIAFTAVAYLVGHHNGKHVSKHQPAGGDGGQAKGDFDSTFILQNMDDGVAIVDKDGIVKLINPAAASLIGWQANEATGLDVNSVLQLIDEHGKLYEDGQRPFSQALTSGKPVHNNRTTLVTKSGRHVPISLVISPINQTSSGGAVGVFRDITREKEEEEARMEFISTASHEMRTPIAALEGYLSLVLNAKNATLDSNSRGFLEKAYKSTKHLGELFQDLLTTTKADDRRLENHPEIVDVSEVLNDVVAEMKSAADAKKLSLHFLEAGDTPSGNKVLSPLYYVKADPERLKEVFRNLLDNGIKYTSAGGVAVRLTGDASVVQVQISDTGSGIPAEDVSHLFQKFYRVDSSMTRQVGGTGLGLFISKKILELYSGRIWVESKLGKGSTFFVNLPRLEQAQPTTGQGDSPVLQSFHQA